MKENLYNDELGISESDINESTDVFQLRRWGIGIMSQIAHIGARIDFLKDLKAKGEADPDQYRRTLGYRSILEVFKELISVRISELNNSHERDKYIISKLADYVGEDVFLSVLEESHKVFKHKRND